MKSLSIVLGLVLTLSSFAAETPKAGSRADTYQLNELQRAAGGVDILWVIDNSGSMTEEQRMVMDITRDFIASLNSVGAVAKLGMLTTDTADLPRLGFDQEVFSNQPDAQTRFMDAVNKLGTQGSPTEQPLMSVLQALKKFPSFRRRNVPLVTIFVTDAPDQSQLTAQSYWDAMLPLVGTAPQFVYGALAMSDFGCVVDEADATYAGSAYEQLISLAGHGRAFSMCQARDQVAQSVSSIGQDLAAIGAPGVEHYVRLDRAVVGTVKVFYQGMELRSGPNGYWDYDAQRGIVIFKDLSFSQSETDSVTITYKLP